MIDPAHEISLPKKIDRDHEILPGVFSSNLPVPVTVACFPGERIVKMSVELMDTILTRDHQGNRLHVVWGEPHKDGSYTPQVVVDYSDNPFKAAMRENRILKKQVSKSVYRRLVAQDALDEDE